MRYELLLVLIWGGLVATGASGQQQLAPKQVTESKSGQVEPSESGKVVRAGGPQETIPVVANHHPLLKHAGSLQQIDEQTLRQLDHSDVERILKQVPGVSLQGEDGYGLRPNIGMRGVNPHRSRKISLLEDGILVAPAPYSAPAAYYFPPTDFFETIEIYKGATALPYGPQNLGGALNLKTRRPQDHNSQQLRLRSGTFGEHKIAVKAAANSATAGAALQAVEIGANGFKTLPTGDATGFKRQDVALDLEQGVALASGLHTFSLRGTFHRETSHETYLGITKSDFQRDPYQRYAASAHDRMVWQRHSWRLGHEFEGRRWLVRTRVYRQTFAREWRKFSGFLAGERTPRAVILADDDSRELAVLRGREDSISTSGSDSLALGTNDRTYVAEGVQWWGEWRPELGTTWEHTLKLGLRYHSDHVARHHYVSPLKVTGGKPVASGAEEVTVTRNKSHVRAKTATISYELENQSWLIVPAIRGEILDLCQDDFLLGTQECFATSFMVGGLGLTYFLAGDYQVFVGVNQGKAPPEPSAGEAGLLEESLNYEVGVRYTGAKTRADLIGFYSDYQNIKGICSQSSGCDLADLDSSFSGGKARIYGLEALLHHNMRGYGLNWPMQFSYTYNFAAFAHDLVSTNPDWGEGQIREGDPLPYIPVHSAFAGFGVAAKTYGANLNYSFTGQRFDQSVVADRKVLDEYGVWDMSLWQELNSWAKWDLKVDNLTDEVYVSSLRPYGYRPGKPRTVSLGFTGTI